MVNIRALANTTYMAMDIMTDILDFVVLQKGTIKASWKNQCIKHWLFISYLKASSLTILAVFSVSVFRTTLSKELWKIIHPALPLILFMVRLSQKKKNILLLLVLPFIYRNYNTVLLGPTSVLKWTDFWHFYTRFLLGFKLVWFNSSSCFRNTDKLQLFNTG